MRRLPPLRLTLGILCLPLVVLQAELPEAPVAGEGEELATFAGGCFWCMEKPFEAVDGVEEVVSGYTGGRVPHPTYKQISRGDTGHVEAVQFAYDPTAVSYEELLDIYWRQINPTDGGGQFADRGSQYRPAIFVHSEEQRAAAEASKQALAESGRFDGEIVVAIEEADRFYVASSFHQDFYRENPRRYLNYARGSGRVGYLRKKWADEE